MTAVLKAFAGIRARLLLVNVLVIAVPIAGIGFARLFETEMLRAAERDMIHQAQIVSQVVARYPADRSLAAARPLVVESARHTMTRLRVLDPEGAVRADSAGSGRGPVLAGRAEIRAALAGRYGAATRVVEGRGYLFSAIPVDRNGVVTGVVYASQSTSSVLAAMHRLRKSLVRVLGWSVLATSVLSLLFAGTIARPLSRLTGIARRIAAGDRSVRLRLDRKDEIGDLARAFDVMERRLHEQALETRQMAANISHELKSPLTSMRGAAELLIDGAAADPVARDRFLRNILGDVERLDRLVTRMLELSRVLSETSPTGPVDYPALLARVAPTATVRYRAGSGPVVVAGANLESVVLNLYDNACAHAAPGTPVSITVDEDHGRLTTAVHNHGAPISPGNIDRIWDRFFTTRSSQGGTGLGLPIARAVVTSLGGELRVESSAEDGTRFEFSIPISRA